MLLLPVGYFLTKLRGSTSHATTFLLQLEELEEGRAHSQVGGLEEKSNHRYDAGKYLQQEFRAHFGIQG